MLMLKITSQRLDTGTERIHLEGRLAGEYVAELQNVAAAARGRASRMALDVSGLTFVDTDGVRLLRELRDANVGIFGCSGFIAQLLELR